MESGGQGWQLIIAGVVSLLTAGISGGVILAILNRRWKIDDGNTEQRQTNSGKMIDANASLVQGLVNRITALEVNLKELQDGLMSLTKTNAQLEIKNEYLVKDVQRRDAQIETQQVEIKALREESDARQGRIKNLEAQVLELTAKVEALTKNE